MKVTAKTVLTPPDKGLDFCKVMGQIERSKYIIAATKRSMGEWRRLEEARFVLQKNGIGYHAEDMDLVMAELKQEVVTQYESVVNDF